MLKMWYKVPTLTEFKCIYIHIGCGGFFYPNKRNKTEETLELVDKLIEASKEKN